MLPPVNGFVQERGERLHLFKRHVAGAVQTDVVRQASNELVNPWRQANYEAKAIVQPMRVERGVKMRVRKEVPAARIEQPWIRVPYPSLISSFAQIFFFITSKPSFTNNAVKFCVETIRLLRPETTDIGSGLASCVKWGQFLRFASTQSQQTPKAPPTRLPVAELKHSVKLELAREAVDRRAPNAARFPG